MLRQKIEKVSTSLTSSVRIRAKLKDAEHLSPVDDLAVLIIDAQEEFCSTKWNYGKGTKELEHVCEKIAKLAPIFRQAGIKIYGIYGTAYKDETPSHFCKWTPTKEDTLIQKFSDSAFETRKVKETLKKHGKRRLLIVGAYTSICIQKTAEHALDAGYEVFVAKDLTYDYGNSQASAEMYHRNGLQEMKKAGAKIITAKQALKMFGAKA